MDHTIVLNQNKEFLKLYRMGKRVFSPEMVIYFKKTKRKYNRLGITVGKKVGCAVQRNRAKRIIRQAYRECEAILPIGMDMVVVAQPAINGVKSTQLQEFLAGTGSRKMRELLKPQPSGEKAK